MPITCFVEKLSRIIYQKENLLDFELICQLMRVILREPILIEEETLGQLEEHIFSRADQDKMLHFVFHSEFSDFDHDQLPKYLAQLMSEEIEDSGDVIQLGALLNDLKRLHARKCEYIELHGVKVPRIKETDTRFPTNLEIKLDELQETLTQLLPITPGIIEMLQNRFQTIISSIQRQ